MKGHILLIEDSEDDIDLTLRAFQEAKIANKVVVVRDGARALEYLLGDGPPPEGLPALILLDLKLPKVDGLEVLQRLRNEERTRMIPVVILTSSTEEQDLINGYKLGANSYIRKPVDFIQFSKAVTQLGLYWLVLNEPPPDRDTL